jgi:hypothetical protein
MRHHKGMGIGVPIADGPKTTFRPLQLSDPQVLICQRADRDSTQLPGDSPLLIYFVSAAML